MYFGIHVKLVTILVLYVLQVQLTWGAVVVNPEDANVLEGEPTSFACQFSVPPKTTVKCVWVKDSAIIEIDQYPNIYEWTGGNTRGNCGFKILNTSNQRDDGVWTCQLPSTATSAGEKSNPARLTVYVTPTPPVLKYKEQVINSSATIDIPANTTVSISCVSRHGNPSPSLTWIFDNQSIQPDRDFLYPEENKKTYSSVIELNRTFTKDDDAKLLQCKLSHISLSSASLSIEAKLNISYDTTQVQPLSGTYVEVDAGSGFDFICKADGNPPPICEWVYNKGDTANWEIKSYTCTYSITSASKEHEGQYMCMAGNKALIPSPAITFKIRSTTKNVVAILGAVIGIILVVAVIVLTIIVFKLRKNVKKESQLPDIDYLNRSLSRPKQDSVNRETYMIPIPEEHAPLNPPPLPKFPPPSKRVSTESNIYAEPHFYYSISVPDGRRDSVDKGSENDPEDRYIQLNDGEDSNETDKDVDLKKPVIVGVVMKEPIKGSEDGV